eukprot:2010095-Rhodomonas_salina.1
MLQKAWLKTKGNNTQQEQFHYSRLGDFLNYMRTCVQAAIIARMATLNTVEGKAWEKAHNKLIELSQETSNLTLDMVQQVVKLAENHFASIESTGIMGGQDLIASPVTVAETEQANATQAGLEQQVSIQAGTIHSLEERLSEISAQ